MAYVHQNVKYLYIVLAVEHYLRERAGMLFQHFIIEATKS